MTPVAAHPLTWVEVDVAALAHNVAVLRAAANSGGRRSGQPGAGAPLLCAMVKGNAYGHGLLVAGRALVAAGVDWLGVGDVGEALALRQAGVDQPLLAVCHIAANQMDEAVACDLRMVVYDAQTVAAAAAAGLAAHPNGPPVRLHLKLDTGTNRQGVSGPAAVALAGLIVRTPGVQLEGVSTHFANIEDTTDHRFARRQLERFAADLAAIRTALGAAGEPPQPLLVHASNTAAVMLWPEVCGDLVRFGIGAYGLCPSNETLVSARECGRSTVDLRPALTWKTRIVQLRAVPAGEWVGYGCTWRTVRDSRLAVLPVGYYDGYDRRLSGVGQVLVGGQRAPVVGRVAMNMIVVDVTDSPAVQAGDEVVLLGRQARAAQGEAEQVEPEQISADEMAAWLGSIHYEVVTRINERIPRVAV